MRVKKFVIEPGDWYYIDEQTGLPRVLHATPELVRHWHDTGKEMLAAGLSIPLPLEHQKAADGARGLHPLTPEEKAAERLRNNAGWVAGYEVDDKGALFAQVDVEDEEIARKLPKTIKWTSPYISTFTDGRGKTWEGVISHLALTTRPRITKQEPFPTVAAALSFTASQGVLPWSPALIPPGKGIPLSRAGKLVVEEGKPARPAYPVAFSLFSGAALSEDDRPKSDAPPKGEPPAKKGGDPAATPPDGLDKVEKGLVDGDGDLRGADVVCHLMEMLGVQLKEGTTDDNLVNNLIEALFSHLKAKGDPMTTPATTPPATPPADGGKPGAPGNNAPAAAPVRQEQPPLYMSLEQARAEAEKLQDPAVKQILQAALSNQEASGRQLATLRERELARAKAERDRRVEALCGKVRTQAFRDRLTAASQGAALSLGDDGTVHDPLASMLDVLETGVKDLPSLLTTPAAQLRELQHPAEYGGEAVTEQQAEAAADGLLARMTNVAPKQKASA